MSNWSESERQMLQALLRDTLSGQQQQAVICLCASWCGVCREFKALFDEARLTHPNLLFRWVDIEDEADQLDELDIETFPTLLLGSAQQMVFAGPILPQAASLSRHLKLLAAGSSATNPEAPSLPS